MRYQQGGKIKKDERLLKPKASALKKQRPLVFRGIVNSRVKQAYSFLKHCAELLCTGTQLK